MKTLSEGETPYNHTRNSDNRSHTRLSSVSKDTRTYFVHTRRPRHGVQDHAVSAVPESGCAKVASRFPQMPLKRGLFPGSIWETRSTPELQCLEEVVGVWFAFVLSFYKRGQKLRC
ncbi:hypothetical protein BaRGS_00012313 [Batillaria attramentaria]|uniref:Uncharacterized protein n=1 Tax=Batillaria attramentaria TaxID=370345 RepID=A0ABD0LA00_9CAEN